MLLRQSTAFTFRLGPFVDSTDGNTQKNALTIAYTDVLLSKAGGALTAKADTTNLTGTGANAHYTCALNATDTNTLGTLRVFCHVTGALPVYKDFLVVPALVYDSLVAGSDNLQVDTTQVSGTAQTARDLGAALVGTIAAGMHNPQSGDAYARLGAPAGASVSADIAEVKTDTAAILVDTGTDGVVLPQAQADKVWNTAVRVLTANTNFNDPTAAAIAGAVWDEILSAHLGSGSTGEALNAAGAAGDPWATALPGAYGAGSAGKIIGDNLNAPVSSRSTLDAAGVRTAVGLAAANLDAQLAALPTAAENAVAVWDETATGHIDAGKAGAQVWTAIDTIAVDVAGLDGAAMRGTDNAALASGVIVTTNNDKTGYSIGAGGIPVGAFAAGAINDAATAADMETAIANAVKAIIVESQGSITLQQAISIMLSALAGVTTDAGATLKSPDGLATRIAATINASNERTAMTLTPST